MNLGNLGVNIELVREIFASEIFRNILSTFILLLCMTVARAFALRLVRRSNIPGTEVRRWIVQIRNVVVLVTLFGIVLIWAAELRTMALSLVAIAAAIVIATKELITCITGGMMRSGARTFTIGDRIEINQIRGDVVDLSLLATTILEIGPGRSSHQYTGRAVTIPNSLFLTTAVVNESFMDEYVLHLLSVPLKRGDDWSKAEKDLLRAAHEVCDKYIDSARKHMERKSHSRGLEAPSVDPRVYVAFPNPDTIELQLRIPVPSGKKGRSEQEILRRYLQYNADKSTGDDQNSHT